MGSALCSPQSEQPPQFVSRVLNPSVRKQGQHGAHTPTPARGALLSLTQQRNENAQQLGPGSARKRLLGWLSGFLVWEQQLLHSWERL